MVFGGGGYNPSNVARAWTVVASTLAEFVTPRESPNDWQRLFEGVVGEKAPALIESSGEAKNEVYDVALKYGSEVLQDLKRRIPLLVS